MFTRYRKTLDLFIKGYGQYKWQIAMLTFLGVGGAFVESLGVTALIPLFSRLAGEWSSTDLGTKTIAQVLRWFGLGFEFRNLLVLIAGAFILKSVLIVVSTYFSIRILTNYEREAKSNLVKGIFKSRWEFLTHQRSGDIETLFTIDIVLARKLLAHISRVIVDVASLIVYIIIAFSISSITTLSSLVIGIVIFLVLKPVLYRTKILAKKVAQLNSDIAAYVFENITGAKTIKSSSRENPVSRVSDGYFDNYRDWHIKLRMFSIVSSSLIEPISVIFVVVVFGLLYTSGNFELGVFVAIMYLVHKIFQHFIRMQGLIYQFNVSVPHLERVIDFQDGLRKNAEIDQGGRQFKLEDQLEFSNVHFNYGGEREILRDFNLRVKKGQMIGVVGKSGSGKTTIVDLLLRLLTPTKGRILSDGTSIDEIGLSAWRNKIGYVSQENFVMNDTLLNNVRFYNNEISSEEVIDATKKAYIYEFIERQTQKFDTVAGERGMLLSGGEKQRIVLARALARKPEILILDEATSALDNESELLIQKAIDDLHGGTTIVIIAHRLSTLMNCDKIIFLENGSIVEEGSPRELLQNKDSSFYRLYNIRGEK